LERFDWKRTGGLPMAQTICMLNQKGGVGKTSSAYHLSGTLARLGKRVLLVDNDPQASLTQGFFGPDGTHAIPPASSVAAAYDEENEPIASTLIQPTAFPGISIIPGSSALAEYNMRPVDTWSRSQGGLRSMLADVDDEYDLVMIDCPPNLHLCSAAALVASTAIIIPLQAEDFGAQGLGPVRGAIAAVQTTANPSLRLAGYLVTMYDRRLSIHLAYEAKLREMFGDDVFTAQFPLAKDYKEAVASRQPISHYKPKSGAAKTSLIVAQELLARLERIAADNATRRVA
jgi:chromosome partitioning protein